jgi:hypothetical protein
VTTEAFEIAVPFRIGPNGGVAVVTTTAEAVKQHIIAIISTRVGERVMRPRYGTNAYDLVLDVADDNVAAQFASELRAAIEDEEPAAVVHDVTAEAIPEDGFPRVRVSVLFSVRPFDYRHEASTTFDPAMDMENS